jgi:AraC-like DNA-binding protein
MARALSGHPEEAASMIWLDEGGRRRDTRLIAPPPSLRGVVEHFWTHQRLPRQTWRVVPDLSGHVIFSLSGSTAVCRIVGARSTYCDIDVSRRDLTLGVRLRPGALPQLIGDSASQLSDRSESLASVIGSAGRRLTERLADSAPDDRLPLLAQFLSGQLLSCRGIWSFETYGVANLAREWEVSRRAVYDRTVAALGIAPKRALRILRLHRALFALHSGATLADVALGAGYCDQPHLTRESVRLLGESPGEWRRRGCSIVQDREPRAHS